MVGAELLRLAGGPGRGWYPRHRQPRPASVEHLDHLAHSPNPGAPWNTRDRDNAECRKPCTLPPNLTPKFFHRSPREALRRVTSLLIRKGEYIYESLCLFEMLFQLRLLLFQLVCYVSFYPVARKQNCWWRFPGLISITKTLMLLMYSLRQITYCIFLK